MELLFRMFRSRGIEFGARDEIRCPVAGTRIAAAAGRSRCRGNPAHWAGGEIVQREVSIPLGNVAVLQSAERTRAGSNSECRARTIAALSAASGVGGCGGRTFGRMAFCSCPANLWGLDDDTIARFEHDTQSTCQATAKSICRTGPVLRQARPRWSTELPAQCVVKWRAKVIAQFYRRLQNELTAVRRDACCTFRPRTVRRPGSRAPIGADLVDRTKIYSDVLLGLGLRTILLRNQRGLVLLRPERIAPPVPMAEQGNDFELNRSQDVDEQLNSLMPRPVNY